MEGNPVVKRKSFGTMETGTKRSSNSGAGSSNCGSHRSPHFGCRNRNVELYPFFFFFLERKGGRGGVGDKCVWVFGEGREREKVLVGLLRAGTGRKP